MMLLTLLTVFRMVVLPVQFSDRQFTQSREQMEAMAAQAEAYFNRQFGGATTFQFDLAPITTLSHTLEWYGANDGARRDVRVAEAVREAVQAQQTQINFSLYDNDSDGSLDNVCLLAAGPIEAGGGDEKALWPQMGWLSASNATFRVGSKLVDRFTLCAEGRLGIFCHETAHVLGLPDLYDTDGEAEDGFGPLLGASLMDESCLQDPPQDFGALEFEVLGLGSCEALAVGHYELQALPEGRRYLKAATANEGESFLFGVRGGGLLVYQIDRSDNPAGHSERYKADLTAKERWEQDVVNGDPDHPCARLIPALPDAAKLSDASFPQAGVAVFGSDSPSPFRSWKGRSVGFALTGIRSLPDGGVAFDVIEPLALTDLSVYQDAAIVCWKASETLKGVVGYTLCWSDGEEEFRQELGPDAASYTIEGLHPRTGYGLSLQVRTAGGECFSVDSDFVTKVYREGNFPYIYLNNTVRNVDGSFPVGGKLPLRVFNATDVQEVRWSLDGRPIWPGADGRYTLQHSGRLTATVIHTDGTTETLLKEITVQ